MSSTIPTLILHASQTGNATEIAKQLYADVMTRYNSLHTRCMAMQDYIDKYKDVRTCAWAHHVDAYVCDWHACVQHVYTRCACA